jgi:hypothetical protein
MIFAMLYNTIDPLSFSIKSVLYVIICFPGTVPFDYLSLFRIIRNGIGIHEHASIDLPGVKVKKDIYEVPVYLWYSISYSLQRLKLS